LKKESDFSMVWNAIDTTKLVSTTKSLVVSLQKYFCERSNNEQKSVEHSSNNVVCLEPIILQQGKSYDDFPVMRRFCIPLEKFWVDGLL
jgi:hypothetical protein